MKQRRYEEDDGRTIADMSGVSRRSVFLPHFPESGEEKAGRRPEPDAEPENDNPWFRRIEVTKQERNAAMRGALTAALLIALVFIAAGALLILLLQLYWNR